MGLRTSASQPSCDDIHQGTLARDGPPPAHGRERGGWKSKEGHCGVPESNREEWLTERGRRIMWEGKTTGIPAGREKNSLAAEQGRAAIH